jgi:hypothetical protein
MLASIELRHHPAGLPCTELAQRLHRRRSDVLTVLEDEPRFVRTGRTCRARWTLARAHGTELDALRRVDATTGSAGSPGPGEARRAA